MLDGTARGGLCLRTAGNADGCCEGCESDAERCLDWRGWQGGDLLARGELCVVSNGVDDAGRTRGVQSVHFRWLFSAFLAHVSFLLFPSVVLSIQ